MAELVIADEAGLNTVPRRTNLDHIIIDLSEVPVAAVFDRQGAEDRASGGSMNRQEHDPGGLHEAGALGRRDYSPRDDAVERAERAVHEVHLSDAQAQGLAMLDE